MSTRTFEHCKIVNIVDGDTVDAEIDLGFTVSVKQRFRLEGIDTPERGRLGWTAARGWLWREILDTHVTLVVTKTDKYGRYLATIFYNGININEKMLELGLAQPYI